jgi:hypothetical protein
MIKRRFEMSCWQWCLVGGLLLLAVAFLDPASARAQQGTVIRDEPTAYQPPAQQGPQKKEPKGFMRVASAVCWYLPNRIADLFDIPRIYITAGDGMGGSVRATKYLNATWFQDSAACLGWGGSARKPPFFSEQLNERYVGFFAAQQGKIQRDPSEVGFSFHFAVVGANVSISLSEAADFVLGFVGIDLRADDHGPVLGTDLTPKPEPPAPTAQDAKASAPPKPDVKPMLPETPDSAKPAQESRH